MEALRERHYHSRELRVTEFGKAVLNRLQGEHEDPTLHLLFASRLPLMHSRQIKGEKHLAKCSTWLIVHLPPIPVN